MRLVCIVAIASLCASFSGMAYAKCDQSGIGHAHSGTRKADLNILKNRSDGPTQTSDVTVADMLGYEDSEDTGREAEGVILKGLFLQRVHEGPESPNCGTEFDYHIFIGALDSHHQSGDPLSAAVVRSKKKKSIVVELTPNIQDQHPDWADKLASLPGTNVCITGWLLYDFEHEPQIGHTRGTLWEIHPVTGIGVLRDDGSCEEWN